MGEFQPISTVQEVNPNKQKKIVYLSAIGVVILLVIILVVLIAVFPKLSGNLPNPNTGPNGEYVAPVVASNVDTNLTNFSLIDTPTLNNNTQFSSVSSSPNSMVGPNGEYVAPQVSSSAPPEDSTRIQGSIIPPSQNSTVSPSSQSQNYQGNVGPNGEYVAPAVESAFYPNNSSVNQ